MRPTYTVAIITWLHLLATITLSWWNLGFNSGIINKYMSSYLAKLYDLVLLLKSPMSHSDLPQCVSNSDWTFESISFIHSRALGFSRYSTVSSATFEPPCRAASRRNVCPHTHIMWYTCVYVSSAAASSVHRTITQNWYVSLARDETREILVVNKKSLG